MGALISSVWIVVLIAWDFATQVKKRWAKFHVLRTLSPGERNLLRNYLTNNTTTMNLPFGDGLPMGLLQRSVLYLLNMIGASPGRPIAFNLEPWAWTILQKHPDLVQ